MSDEPTKRQPGRPRKQREPWREIRIRISEDVLARINDMLAPDGIPTMSAYFERAAREMLARDEREPAVERTAGRPAKTTTKE